MKMFGNYRSLTSQRFISKFLSHKPVPEMVFEPNGISEPFDELRAGLREDD